jgi:hypothetical protein
MNINHLRAHVLMHHVGSQPVIGVETGVFSGAFCSTLLPIYPNLIKLYGVDQYREFHMRPEWPQSRWDDLCNRVVKMMSQYGDRWQLIRKPAMEALDHVPGDLDFVYLDDDHSFEAVSAELPLYEKKVKKGGIFCGHDFNDDFPGLQEAVIAYARDNQRKITVEPCVSMWWWHV